MIATTIEQSKKLLELGLSPESADMHYRFDDNLNTLSPFPFVTCAIGSRGNKTIYNSNCLPAWSLSALLGLMPLLPSDLTQQLMPPELVKFLDKYQVLYASPGLYYTGYCDSAIEAAFDMVVWLIENDFIKTEKV